MIGLLIQIGMSGHSLSNDRSTIQDVRKSKELVSVKSMKLIVDDENRLSFKDVRELDLAKVPTRNFPYIVSRNTVWAVIEADFFEQLSQDDQLSIVGNACHITLYYHTALGGWQSIVQGLGIPTRERSFLPTFRFPFSDIDDLVYIQFREPVLPLIVAEDKIIGFNRLLMKTGFNAIVIGGLLIILLINLFRWISDREKIYGLYSAYIASFIMTIMVFGGNNFLYLFGSIPPYTKFIIHLASVFQLNLMATIYAVHFLQLKKHLPILYKIARYVILLICTFYIYMFVDLAYFAELANFTIAITLTLLFTAGLLLLKRGHSYMIFYVIAYALFTFLHIDYMIIRHYNPTIPYTFPVNIAWAGFFFEALLLNISLNRKISFDKKIAEEQYTKSQEELVAFQSQQNATLEKSVKDRTQELEESMEELRKVEKDLKSANAQARRRNRELNEAIGKLQETQSKLIESEKMASLGILSAGIGHEINNPLNFIKGGMSVLSEHLKSHKASDSETQKLVGIVNEGVSRASSIVKSLSHFSRKTEEMDENCNINEAIENCLVILENRLKHKVLVKKNFAKEGPICIGNEGRLHQAFINVLSNAEQSISGNGTIEITTTVGQGKIRISIADDGAGIEKEHLAKIMDPFFTTKDPGEGTGLGLSITYKIIEQHNGKIKVKSKPGSGTTFEIILPQAT